MATAPIVAAQVTVEVGVAPDCHTGTMTPLHMTWLPVAITARNGLRVVYFLVLARGFMALITSGAMWITVFTPNTAIPPQSRSVARNPSRRSVWIRFPTSKKMKFGTGAAT